MIPFLPSSVVGSNWSTPNGMLHGLTPADPMVKKQSPIRSTPIWELLALTHWRDASCWGVQDGGCNSGNQDVKLTTIKPYLTIENLIIKYSLIFICIFTYLSIENHISFMAIIMKSTILSCNHWFKSFKLRKKYSCVYRFIEKKYLYCKIITSPCISNYGNNL